VVTKAASRPVRSARVGDARFVGVSLATFAVTNAAFVVQSMPMVLGPAIVNGMAMPLVVRSSPTAHRPNARNG
jgi:hypothetical protein